MNGAARAAAESDLAGDRVLGFSVPGRNARGRLVRMDELLRDILRTHAYPPAAAEILAQALVLTALVGSTLRGEGGQMTLQAQSRGGAVTLLVCDYRDGAVRGYLKLDPELGPTLRRGQSVEEAFGQGHFAITLERDGPENRYQGIVPLHGASLLEATERYFADSEQVPTFLRVATDLGHPDGPVAGGLLVQHLPKGEEGGPRLFATEPHPDWTHVHILASTLTEAELVDRSLPFEALLWRLFHEEEVRVLPAVPLARGCRCSAEHFRDVLSRFTAGELDEMRNAEGTIEVDCAFCARLFPVDI